MATVVPAKRSARDRVLDTASQLFYRDGYHAVGIDTIVEHSGVAKMTLYRHFPSKDDLIAAYLERANAEFWDWLEREIAAVDDPRAKLLAAFAATARLATSAQCLGCTFQAAASEFPELEHPGHEVASAHKRQVLDRLAELARDAGLTDPDGLAAQLLLLMDGAWVAARMFGPGNHAAAVAEAAQALIEARAGSPSAAALARARPRPGANGSTCALADAARLTGPEQAHGSSRSGARGSAEPWSCAASHAARNGGIPIVPPKCRVANGRQKEGERDLGQRPWGECRRGPDVADDRRAPLIHHAHALPARSVLPVEGSGIDVLRDVEPDPDAGNQDHDGSDASSHLDPPSIGAAGQQHEGQAQREHRRPHDHLRRLRPVAQEHELDADADHAQEGKPQDATSKERRRVEPIERGDQAHQWA